MNERLNNSLYPAYFCKNKSKVKAFVLGADPSNFSDKGNTVLLKTVFGIGGGDKRYFQGILKNLVEIGLGWDDIYVQNLIGCFLTKETSKNTEWDLIAEGWLPKRIEEFDLVDKTKSIPILITAEKILKFLLNDGMKYYSAEEYYSCSSKIPIIKNKFGRPIIPFYRHQKYKLNKPEWVNYRNKLVEIIKVIR